MAQRAMTEKNTAICSVTLFVWPSGEQNTCQAILFLALPQDKIPHYYCPLLRLLHDFVFNSGYSDVMSVNILFNLCLLPHGHYSYIMHS